MAPSGSKTGAQFVKPIAKPAIASQLKQNTAAAPVVEAKKIVNPVLTNNEKQAPPSATASSTSSSNTNTNTEKDKTGKSF